MQHRRHPIVDLFEDRVELLVRLLGLQGGHRRLLSWCDLRLSSILV